VPYNYYNSERKVRYLERCRFAELTIPVIEQWFSKAAVVEADLGKDLAEFNRNEIVNLFKSFNGRSKQTLTTVSYFFSDYYSWCISEGYISNKSVINHYELNMIKSVIDEVLPIELIEDKYYRKQDIYDYLDRINDKANQFALYAVFRGCLGSKGEDILNLKMSDIDEENKTAKLHSGKTINIDDLFIKLAKEANAQTQYVPKEGATNFYGRLDYSDNIFILKSCGKCAPDETLSYIAFQQRFMLIRKQAGNRFINANNTYSNGLMNYIKERFNEMGVSLLNGFMIKANNQSYKYSKELDKFIAEYGSNLTGRMLRMRYADIIEYFE
jgi:integrase